MQVGVAEPIRPDTFAAAGSGGRDAVGPGDRPRLETGDRARAAHRDRDQLAGQLLGVASCDEDDLYAAMDWVLARKDSTESCLAARHFSSGTLVLHAVPTAAFEGRTCPLGRSGTPRDGVRGGLQIVHGLLCSTAVVPVAIEVPGQTPPTRNLDHPSRQAQNPVGAVAGVSDRGSGHAHQCAYHRGGRAPCSWIGSAHYAPGRLSNCSPSPTVWATRRQQPPGRNVNSTSTPTHVSRPGNFGQILPSRVRPTLRNPFGPSGPRIAYPAARKPFPARSGICLPGDYASSALSR